MLVFTLSKTDHFQAWTDPRTDTLGDKPARDAPKPNTSSRVVTEVGKNAWRQFFLKPVFIRLIDPSPAPLQCVRENQELSYRQQLARQLRTRYAEGIYRRKCYTVTLKSRLSVTQGHWKRNHRIDHTRLSSSRVI